MNTAILAGRGASLSSVDWSRLPDVPVCCVNSAFEIVPRCDWIAMVDRPRKVLGRTYTPQHVEAFQNEKIVKVFPATRKPSGRRPARLPSGTRSIEYIERLRSHEQDEREARNGRWWLDGKMPLMRWKNKTTLFALQYLVCLGYNDFIMVGHDLDFKDERPYFDSRTVACDQARRTKNGLNEVYDALKRVSQMNIGMRFQVVGRSRLRDFFQEFTDDHDRRTHGHIARDRHAQGAV